LRLLFFIIAMGLSITACNPEVSQRQSPAFDELLSVEIENAMESTSAVAMAIAVIRDGQVTHVSAHGIRDTSDNPLETETIMYAASITKAAFAYMVLQLVDEGLVDLDTPISEYLPEPLPSYTGEEIEDLYSSWSDLEGDDRWGNLTLRILLTHSPGFANFAFLEPDRRLRFHFEPGEQYSYSGVGFILAQFVLEYGLELDVRQEMQMRVFDHLGMPNSDMMWRDDFAENNAYGWDQTGQAYYHDDRSKTRAAGSLDSTIADIAQLAAGLVRGEGLSEPAREEFTGRHLPITVRTQFPTLQDELPADEQIEGFFAGLGVVVFDGPQGPGFMKGGHNEMTGNTMVCLIETQDCVVILANDVRAEAAFPALVEYVLGETGAPWSWEYGNMEFWQRNSQ